MFTSPEHISCAQWGHRKAVESNGSIVIKIAAEDKPLPSWIYVEAVDAFRAATEILLRYVHGWVLTKANPDLVQKWKQDQDTKSGA